VRERSQLIFYIVLSAENLLSSV